MSVTSDARFWDRAARKYAKSAISDQAGYERSLNRTRSFLNSDDSVLELGCGTGTTALRLAGDVRSYIATDISTGMVAIAEAKRIAAQPTPGLVFRTATLTDLSSEVTRFNTVLAFNCLHLIRDLPDSLRLIHALLAADGLLITKTPCIGDMNPLIRVLLLPAMRAIGKAPHVRVFRKTELSSLIRAAGFEIVAAESHATKGSEFRPYIVARKT